MELLVQKFLRSGGTLDRLKEEHGINARISNGKISLSYHQLDSKNNDKLACECRGLVLKENSYDIVALPIARFFNYGDPNAAKIDWSTVKYEEKLDGTLLICYYDFVAEKWCVATRSMPEAEGMVGDIGVSFAQLTNITIHNMVKRKNPNILFDYTPNLQDLMSHMELERGDIKSYTFCFELTAPENRIVCDYKDRTITLLAVRNNITGEELLPSNFELPFYDLKSVKTYSFADYNEMIFEIGKWKPSEHEGLVIKDINFNRLKIKTPSYVAQHRAKDALESSWRGCVEIILLGNDDDIITFVPAYVADRIIKLKSVISLLLKTVESNYEELKNIQDIKEFALKAQKTLWSAPLFAMKRGKVVSVRDFIFSKSVAGEVPTSTLNTILNLCEKLDPTLEMLN